MRADSRRRVDSKGNLGVLVCRGAPLVDAQIEQDVTAYYDAKLREFGATPDGVDWDGEAAQVLRFEQLTRVLERLGPDEPFGVLDVGCECGALVAYLQRRFPDFTYVGYDISIEMVKEARRPHR